MQPSDCPHRVKEESIAFQGFFSVKLDILESFSGYSECFDIENLEIIKSIFDGKVNLNEGNS
jgi:hypothetical protein